MKSKPKINQVSKIKFVTKFNPMLPNYVTYVISISHSDDPLRTLFPKDCLSTIYERNKNLKELIAPSTYPKKINTRTSSITNYNNCDIWKNDMIFDNTFICTATGTSYFMRGQLNCESINVIISKCLEQYVGSAVKFKTRFCIHKSVIKTKKERCGSARHFNSKCYHDINPFQYLKVQLIEQVHCKEY